jgi:hypothetical protein
MPYPMVPNAAPAKPPSRWKTWHKATLGVIGALALCLCGIAVFAPDPEPGGTTGPGTTAAAGQLVDVPSTPAAAAPTTRPVAVPTSKPTAKPTTKKPTTAPTTKKAVHYADCDAAPGPLRKGEPGYRKALDRDKDGIACERGGDDDDQPAETPTDDDSRDDGNSGGTDPRFATCAKAKSAGYGPYYRGSDPEYDWYIDRDNDGAVCE